MDDGNRTICYTQVLGQEKAKKLVSRSLLSGRIPHAFIFKGPDGVGKQLFAKGLAAALNCRALQDGCACGQCPSCLKFRSLNHPDYLEVRPEKGAIKINQIREMCRALEYPPYESKYRVVLLEDVHTMRQEAANSLLKTLEEPPNGNILVLTAEASREVLTTISSRCQVVPFYGLSEELTVRVLQSVEPKLGDEQASLLARLSEGSPGRGLLLNRTDMITLFKRLTKTVSDPELDGNRDVHILLNLGAEMAELKENLPALLGLLRLWLRDLLLAAGGLEPGQDLYGSGRESGKRLKQWSSETLFAKLAAVDRAESELGRNCNRTLVCEVLLFKLHG